MKDITRRSFTRSLVGFPIIGMMPKSLYSKENSRDSYLKKDWDEAIKENNLRKEVRDLMINNNTSVSYDVCLDYKNIIGFDISVQNLRKIRDDLKRDTSLVGMVGHRHYLAL